MWMDEWNDMGMGMDRGGNGWKGKDGGELRESSFLHSVRGQWFTGTAVSFYTPLSLLKSGFMSGRPDGRMKIELVRARVSDDGDGVKSIVDDREAYIVLINNNEMNCAYIFCSYHIRIHKCCCRGERVGI